MTESKLREIAERLDRIEKQCRYVKLAGIVLLSVAAVSLLAGAAKTPEIPREIKAQRISLVDSEGRERVVMEHGGEGPTFNMLNSKGAITFRIAVADESASMRLSARPGQDGLTLLAGEQGSELNMYGKDNAEQIHLETRESWSELDVTGPNKMHSSKIIAWNYASSIGSGEIGKGRVSIMAGTGNGGAITLWNKTGEPVVDLEVDERGNGLVGVYNRRGMRRTLKPRP